MSEADSRSSRHRELAALQAEHERALLRYAGRIVGPDWAHDVVQDVFSRWLTTGSPPSNGTEKAWLFTVARNRALDLLRRDRRMRHTDTEDQLPQPTVPSAHELAELSERDGQILLAMAELPAVQQDVLRLKFQNDFSYKQIAEITGKSVSHVGVLIHDGLKSLRKQFKTIGLLG